MITYRELCAIEERAVKHFRASAAAWERANDGKRSAEDRARLAKREQDQAAKGEALLKPFGISCDWPGLYPSFTVRGFTVHSVRDALSDAVRVEVAS